ncbi:cyclin-domain-containing protein [Hesseltinella vesiculosa]|uniref:Cyclin-domain-containing protein n=1 Tax=Hesseltinella vesiculosa TaxID=101127 RepID=A0A1X2G6W8_9FUNG|nr:cyclin-domain-containing protein [Hesseltinella vesiculosa]
MQFNIAEFPALMLVHIVADLLESIIQTNDQWLSNHDTPLTHFHSRAKPSISILAYLTRILKFAPFNNEALLSLLVYFDRIAAKRQYAINSLNAHRLLITSVVVASKFTSDVYYPNSRYAKVGGLPLLELNQLELEFLFLCDFQLHISVEDLQEYGNQLLKHAMSKETTFSLAVEHCLPPSPQPSHEPIRKPSTASRQRLDLDNQQLLLKQKKQQLATSLHNKRHKPTNPYPTSCNRKPPRTILF